jgi:hypothetical protein
MRKVEVARRAPVLAVGVGEGRVQIWNWQTGEKVTEFNTVLDGSDRLAVSASGERLVAANWRKGQKAGVACYETFSGGGLWHRPDLGQVQSMSFSIQRNWIYCRVEGRPAHILDAQTGATVETLRGVLDAMDSPYSRHRILQRRDDFVIEGSKDRFSVARYCNSGLEASCGPGVVCLHEAFNPTTLTIRSLLRCIDCETGKERWRFQPPDGRYMQLISYQADGFFYCVQTENRNEEWIVDLLRLSLADGALSEVCRLNSPPPYFGGFGDGILVTPGGHVVSLQSGAVLRVLAFGTS